MHKFKLIQGDVNRPYYEASPITDLYECEHCGMQVNTVWLQEHPEEACPKSDS